MFITLSFYTFKAPKVRSNLAYGNAVGMWPGKYKPQTGGVTNLIIYFAPLVLQHRIGTYPRRCRRLNYDRTFSAQKMAR